MNTDPTTHYLFDVSVKLHSGLTNASIEVPAENLDVAWYAAFEEAMLFAESIDGVLLGISVSARTPQAGGPPFIFTHRN